MAYDVDVQINLTVKGFPPLKATIKPKNITDANSKSLTFTNDDKTCLVKFERPTKNDPNNVETRKMYCKRFKLANACDVAFVGIKAKSYRYKACPTGDVSGIGFFLTEAPLLTTEPGKADPPAMQGQDGNGCVDSGKIVWIDSDYIAVDFCARSCPKCKDPSDQWISVFLDPAMFECNPNPQTTFDVTVAYGLVGEERNKAEPQSCCEPVALRQQNNNRQFQTA